MAIITITQEVADAMRKRAVGLIDGFGTYNPDGTVSFEVHDDTAARLSRISPDPEAALRTLLSLGPRKYN